MWKLSQKNSESFPKAMWFIVLLAMTIRLLLLFFAYPGWEHGMTHEVTASSILEGKGFSEKVVGEDGRVEYIPSAHDMPGAALLLVLTWTLFGTESFLYVQLLQIVLDSLLCVIVFLIARYFFSDLVSLLGSFLYAMYLPQATMAVQPRADVWLTFGLVLSVYCMIRFFESRKLWFLLLVGLIIGFTVYFKPNILFLPLFLGVPLALKFGVKKGLILSSLTMSIVLVILSPWVIRNYVVFERFILTRTPFYQTMWEGFGEFQNPFGAVNNDEATYQQMRKEGFQGRLATAEYDDFIKPRVLKVIKEHPVWYMSAVLRRIPKAILVNRIPWGVLQDKQYFYHQMFAENMEEKSIWRYAKRMIDLNPGFLVTKAFDVLVFALFVVGVFLTRQNFKELMILFIVPVYLILVHIPIHVEGRYMVPFHWVYLLFGAYAILHFSQKLFVVRKSLTNSTEE
jgi:hypothetical protein